MGFRFEGRRIEADDDTLVLDALLAAGEGIDHGCRSGACQRCLLRAEGGIPRSAQNGLSGELKSLGHFLSCQAKTKDVEDVFCPGRGAIGSRPGRVVERVWLSDTVILVRISLGADFEYQAGQFVRLEAEDGLQRSYSIASPSRGGHGTIDLHVRLVPGGRMSEVLGADSVVGRGFTVHGPMGDCVYRADERPILLIGSGTGLAPLYGVLMDAFAARHASPVRLYHGSARAEGLYFVDQLKELESSWKNFSYVACCDEGEGARLGSPLDLALSDLGDLDGYRVYSCGHPALVRAAQKRCFLAGADLSDIHVDAFEDSNDKSE